MLSRVQKKQKTTRVMLVLSDLQNVNEYVQSAWVLFLGYIFVQTIINIIALFELDMNAMSLDGQGYNLYGIESLSANTIEGTLSTGVQKGITGLGHLNAHLDLGNHDLKGVNKIDTELLSGIIQESASREALKTHWADTLKTSAAKQPYITQLGAFTQDLDANHKDISDVSHLQAQTLVGTLTTAVQPNIHQMGTQSQALDMNQFKITNHNTVTPLTVKTLDGALSVTTMEKITELGPFNTALNMNQYAIKQVDSLNVSSRHSLTITATKGIPDPENTLAGIFLEFTDPLHPSKAPTAQTSWADFSTFMSYTPATQYEHGDHFTVLKAGIYSVCCRWPYLVAAGNNSYVIGFLAKNLDTTQNGLNNTIGPYFSDPLNREKFLSFGFCSNTHYTYYRPLGSWVGYLQAGDTLHFICGINAQPADGYYTRYAQVKFEITFLR